MAKRKTSSIAWQQGMTPPASEAVVGMIPEGPEQPKVVYRLAGDAYLLVEYGEMTLDLDIRFRVSSLEQSIKSIPVEGVLETVPGVRSLLIKYNGLQLPLSRLLDTLKSIEKNLPPTQEVEVTSRVIHLPIAFHDRWTREAIAKYIQSVRAEAPYLPDNVQFVARCNGLESLDQVITYLQATQHLVIGLGDVYLGAPCAVPLDPRYRLAVPKYNPARMNTPEGAVGIGGSYVCIYPMESPGGYQLVGRTLSIWNTWQTTPSFAEAPWLLRLFDRIQFESTSEDDLLKAREAMLSGSYTLRIEEETFSVKEYKKFLASVRDEAEAFKAKQKDAAKQWAKGY